MVVMSLAVSSETLAREQEQGMNARISAAVIRLIHGDIEKLCYSGKFCLVQ
jgi:hypothetical protein